MEIPFDFNGHFFPSQLNLFLLFFLIFYYPSVYMFCFLVYLSCLQMILPAARQELQFKAALHSLFAAGVSPMTRALGGLTAPTGSTNVRRVQAHLSWILTLEAFSHNPTHNSFTPSAMTNCSNQWFLSYQHVYFSLIFHI